MFRFRVLANSRRLPQTLGQSRFYSTTNGSGFGSSLGNEKSVRSSDFSSIDTNVTTFAIKSPEYRVFRDRGFKYGWGVNENNIHFRFQNLRRVEVERLYNKLLQGMHSI
jgi:hypothetical protein